MKGFLIAGAMMLIALAVLAARWFNVSFLPRRRQKNDDVSRLSKQLDSKAEELCSLLPPQPPRTFELVQVGVIARAGEYRIVETDEARTGVRLMSIPRDLLERYHAALREWNSVQRHIQRFPTALRPRKPRSLTPREPRVTISGSGSLSSVLDPIPEETAFNKINRSMESAGMLRRNDEPEVEERIIENSGPLIPEPEELTFPNRPITPMSDATFEEEDDEETPVASLERDGYEIRYVDPDSDSSLEDVPPTPLEQAIEEARKQTDGAPTSAEGEE